MKNDLYHRHTSTALINKEIRYKQFTKAYFKQCIAPLVPSDKKARILEIGCGYGRYIRELNDLGYINVEGVDINSEQISYAKKKFGLSNVFKMDAFDWLETHHNYDCILAIDILEHFELDSLMRLTGLIKRALCSSGRLIIQAPNACDPFLIHRYYDLTHERAFSPHSIEQLLLNYNFTNIRHFSAFPPVRNITSLIRRLLWMIFIRPLISIVMVILYGKKMGEGIYTANIITLAFKE